MNGEDGPRIGEHADDDGGTGGPRRRLIASLCEGWLKGVGSSGLSGASVCRAVKGQLSSLVYNSDEMSAALADLQLTLGEGPAATALTEQRPVLLPDISASPPRGTWVAFSAEAVRVGVRSVLAVPLQIGVVGLGVLTLHGRHPATLERRDLAALFVVADALTQVLLPWPVAGANQGEADWDLGLGPNDSVVHQVTGMVAVQLRSSAEDALLNLRAYAFASGTGLIEVARRVVERSLSFDEASPDTTLREDHEPEKGDRDG